MEKYYQVAIIESKKYDGSCEGSAKFEHRSRALTFDKREDAVSEFQKQVEKTKAVIQYAKRHASTEEINIIIDILVNGSWVDDEYFYTTSYKDGVITSDWNKE